MAAAHHVSSKDSVHIDVSVDGLTVISTVGECSSRIVMCGYLDLCTVSALGLVVDRLLRDGPANLDVDVAALTFFDGAGIQAFASAYGRCHRSGGRLRLDHASARARRLLALVGCEYLLGSDRTELGIEAG